MKRTPIEPFKLSIRHSGLMPIRNAILEHKGGNRTP